MENLHSFIEDSKEERPAVRVLHWSYVPHWCCLRSERMSCRKSHQSWTASQDQQHLPSVAILPESNCWNVWKKSTDSLLRVVHRIEWCNRPNHIREVTTIMQNLGRHHWAERMVESSETEAIHQLQKKIIRPSWLLSHLYCPKIPTKWIHREWPTSTDRLTSVEKTGLHHGDWAPNLVSFNIGILKITQASVYQFIRSGQLA